MRKLCQLFRITKTPYSLHQVEGLCQAGQSALRIWFEYDQFILKFIFCQFVYYNLLGTSLIGVSILYQVCEMGH